MSRTKSEGSASFSRRSGGRDACTISAMALPPYPKMELHVHLEATVTPALLLRFARRNGADLRYRTVEELEAYYAGASSFEEFIARWIVTSRNLQTYDDFREIVVEYARTARDQGVVYAEAICSPTEPLLRGTPWEVMFEGYCDGITEAAETFAVEVRLTPDASRDFPARLATTMAKWCVKYRDRGVVALSLGGTERKFAPDKFRRAFAIAREGGLGSAPHAGEFAGGKAGAPSIRAALDVLHADRLRHGIRAVDDAALLAELAERGVVCDVAPTSNLRLGAVASIEEHPLPRMLEAGVKCSISTDDPVLLGTDLLCEHEIAIGLGHSPRAMYDHAVAGVLCDPGLRVRLSRIGREFDWEALEPDEAPH